MRVKLHCVLICDLAVSRTTIARITDGCKLQVLCFTSFVGCRDSYSVSILYLYLVDSGLPLIKQRLIIS
jgi:hypothetical protein